MAFHISRLPKFLGNKGIQTMPNAAEEKGLQINMQLRMRGKIAGH